MKIKKAVEKANVFFRKIIRFVEKNPEKALVWLCAFGLLYAAFLVFLPKPPVYYSVLYLEPGNYGESRAGFFAHFGIENHESHDYNYEVSFFLDSLNDDNSFDSIPLGKKSFFIKKDENFSGFYAFQIPETFAEIKNPRFRIATSAFDENYLVHFWLKK